MSNSELQEWKEYYNLEPFHSDRNELQMALLMAIQSNKAGGKSKVDDFVISNKKEPKKSRKDLGGIAKHFMKQWENVDG